MPDCLRRMLTFAVLAFVCGCGLRISSAQEPTYKPVDVTFAEFGFDERAMPESFNLLSIQIRNNSAEPFEGTLRLRRLLSSTGAWTDVEQTQPLYLSPFSVKLVQFFPYVLDTSEEWEIRWGETLDETYIVEQAALTSGARVLFNDPQRVSGVTLGLKGFREDHFPPTVTGTEGLALAVLDHLPTWEEPRRRAFRDWLYRGGVLHVLLEADGEFPQLPIAELNQEPRPTRYGAGRVYWHSKTRGELTKEYVYESIYPTVRNSTPLAQYGMKRGFIDPTDPEFFTDLERHFQSYSDWDSDALLPNRLKELVRPRHNWYVIYAASGIYMLLLFPGGLILSRTKLDYRCGLFALIVIVAGFSWMFRSVGARGYGESTKTLTAAIAHALPEGRFDIELWSSLFVTDGGKYAITHTGESGVYSTAQNVERIDGQATSGRRATLTSDMPPFTFRTLTHRTQLPLGTFRIAPLPGESPTTTPSEMTVAVEGAPAAKVRSGVVVIGNLVYPLNVDVLRDGKGRLTSGDGQPLEDAVEVMNSFRKFRRGEVADLDRGFDRFRDWLMIRDLGLRLLSDIPDFKLSDDRVRVYVLCELPEALDTRDANSPKQPLGSQSGRLLYSLDVTLPAAPAGL
ncbi:hypothetical protein GC176_10630 [bacterium]|nr:hypothetical protein [bacterium]